MKLVFFPSYSSPALRVSFTIYDFYLCIFTYYRPFRSYADGEFVIKIDMVAATTTATSSHFAIPTKYIHRLATLIEQKCARINIENATLIKHDCGLYLALYDCHQMKCRPRFNPSNNKRPSGT